MIRLDARDFADPARLGRIAAAAKMTPEGFKDRFGYLLGKDVGAAGR
jgi:hypothetical protein